MGLGSTAKKIQAVAERAEQLYEQVIELQKRTVKLEESVDESTERLRALEVESEKQTVLLRAIAQKQGLDVDQILANAAIEEAEGGGSAGSAEADATAVGGGENADGEPTVVDSSGDPVE